MAQTSIDKIDSALMQISSLKAMFGTMICFINPGRTEQDMETENLELWLRDINNRLDAIGAEIAEA